MQQQRKPKNTNLSNILCGHRSKHNIFKPQKTVKNPRNTHLEMEWNFKKNKKTLKQIKTFYLL